MSEIHLNYLQTLQAHILETLSALDPSASVRRDAWARPEGGGGLSCVLEDGAVFERGGVNFSHVMGKQLPPSATASRPQLAGSGFEAMGVSLVFHPRNPYVPTVHMNVRYFEARTPDGEVVCWFGGGLDLTPYYGNEDDVVHFHRVCHDALAPFGAQFYREFKAQCDRYFFLKHRGEARGVGGLFFDDFFDAAIPESGAALWRAVGDCFLPAYVPIVERRKDAVYGEREREFQAYRRGRYVEFNLIYDRGTIFGLQSGGRTESILMSMPPRVRWAYDWQPEPGSPEEALYTRFLPHRDWI